VEPFWSALSRSAIGRLLLLRGLIAFRQSKMRTRRPEARRFGDGLAER
jgi:hypothetical protein